MYLLGIDLGSVSTDFVLIDEKFTVKRGLYLKTKGNPIKTIKEGFKILKDEFKDMEIMAVGTTGSGRHICAAIIGGDAIKNEITAHAVAALQYDNSVRTIIEIGGQDSKIILLNNGIVTDFSMNTVCAAGTGSFIDRQAERLEIPIEDFGKYSLLSKNPVRIAGRCAVFAESDMIHKQQLGYNQVDIISGLCKALVRNYLNNVAKGKKIKGKVLFQGGVAANLGIKAAFEEELGLEIIVPKYYNMMGAIGAAIIAGELALKKNVTNFRGFSVADKDVSSKSFECEGCSNNCEISEIKDENNILGYFGDRCGKWTNMIKKEDDKVKKFIV